MAYKLKKDPIKDIPKAQFIFWIIVRISMIICAAYSFATGDVVMGFESVFCFIFTHLWDMFQIFGHTSFIIEVPPLSQTMLNLIIFIGIVFGSYLELFDKISWFDNFMHILSGFVCAVFAYDFAVIIQRKKGQCAATLAALFSIMFVLSIAVSWEFYEFLMDTFHGTNLQLSKHGAETEMFDISKYRGEYGYLGLVDTMTDMMMNAVGGIVGMIFMIILRNRRKKTNNMNLDDKENNLKKIIKSYSRVAVAFSAGADSTLLLKMCIDTLGKENVIAISAYLNAFPDRERGEVITLCKKLDAKNIQFEINQMGIEHFSENSPERCYYCKKAILREIIRIAGNNGYYTVLEGSNSDDENDYRPGMKAVKELHISSPLKDAGLNKNEIRILSKKLNLPTYNKPSSPCLATRIEYYDEITDEKLSKIEKAEEIIFNLGIRQVRVRMYKNNARIEVPKDSMQSILANADLINTEFKKLNFNFVSLSLAPYKTGSMNTGINNNV